MHLCEFSCSMKTAEYVVSTTLSMDMTETTLVTSESMIDSFCRNGEVQKQHQLTLAGALALIRVNGILVTTAASWRRTRIQG